MTYVCICEDVNDSEISRLIKEGFNTVDKIKDASYAGTECGACIEVIMDMIDKNDKQLQRVRKIAEGISYPNYRLRIERDNASPGGRIFLQWVFDDVCIVTGKMKEWHCRKWYLSDFMLDSEIVKTAFAGAMASAEHQCREKFRYNEVRLFNPHTSLKALMEASARETTRDNPVDED